MIPSAHTAGVTRIPISLYAEYPEIRIRFTTAIVKMKKVFISPPQIFELLVA